MSKNINGTERDFFIFEYKFYYTFALKCEKKTENWVKNDFAPFFAHSIRV